jgi:hypothetical protein
MNRYFLALGLGSLLLGAMPALGQTPGLPAELVDALTAEARSALPMARMEDGSNVPAESEAERARPLVPRDLEVQTIERGIMTGQMEACGLDWQNGSYHPYMQALRRRYHGKPIAYLGLLHGMSQGMTTSMLSEQGFACTDDLRARLTATAANRAIDVP